MAATVQLNIQTNEAQVRTQLQGLQQQLNQLTSRSYNIHINAQLQASLTQQLTSINGLLRQIRDGQNLHVNVSLNNAQNTINALGSIENSMQRISRTNHTVTDSYNTLNQTINNYNRQQQDNIQQNNILIGVLRSLGHILVHEVRAAFNSALTEMKNVDTELITIQKVTNESAQGMKRYADDAYEVASRLGAGASEYLNAVAEFAKAGYKDKSKELGELAITAAKVGDTTQQMANQFLLSVDAAYQYKGSIEDLTAVLDGANEIGNRFPTSVQKIAEGLGKVSPIAAQAHVGIAELTAAIGTITAVTQRSGTEAATALRALYLNIIGDTKTEIEDGAKWTAGEIEGLRDLLRKYAGDLVKAADETGKVINPMEAVRSLYLAMKEGVLTEQELMQQVSDIGGKLRSSQLLALIQNFDKYEQMLETYRDSAGSAAQEYGIYLDSWEAKTKQLSATWTDFVQRQLGTDKIKGLLDILIKVVENFDDWVPLIEAIAAAIVLINIPALTEQIARLFTALNSVQGVIGVVAMMLGLLATENERYVNGLKKAASESAKEADKAKQTADSYMELAAQLDSAKEGSEEYTTASEKIREALGKEGEAVDDLSKKWHELTRQKIIDEQTAAYGALAASEAALVADYNKIRLKSFTVGSSDLGWSGDNAAPSWHTTASKMFTGSSAVTQNKWTQRYTPSSTNASGIAAYYQAIGDTLAYLNTQASEFRKKGDEAAASEILNSDLFASLSFALDGMSGSLDTYNSAIERTESANTALKGFDIFTSWSAWLKEEGRTKEELENFGKQLEECNELTEEQKKILLDLAIERFPQYADALGGVAAAISTVKKETEAATSALEKFQAATKKGSEKDDPFKSYKEVYDTVIKEGKKGRYGSNAFQYGIQALLDPDTIEKFKGDWAGLVTYMQTSLGGLYKDGESMGTGLLDKIVKGGEKVSKSLYEMRDENGKLLASFDKKSGAFRITEDPEGIKILASKVGMSAESLIAAAMGLGAIDPNANAEGLKSALDKILGRGEGEEDPTVTALNASAEAQNTSSEAQNAAAEAENAAAEALLTVAQKLGYGGERGNDAGEADGGVPGDNASGEPSSSSYVPDGIPAPPMTAEEQKRVFDIMQKNVAFGMTAGAINEIWGRLTTGDPFGFFKVTGGDRPANRPKGTPNHHRTAPEETFRGTGQWVDYPVPEVKGAVAEGVEQGLIESSQNPSSPVFHGTGSWSSPTDIPSAVSEGVQQGLKESASFSGTGKFVSADQIPGVNQGKFVSSDQIPSVAVDTTEAAAALEETQAALDEIDNTEAEATATVDPSGAIEGAAAATSAIESIPTEVASHVVVNVDINMTRHGLGAGGSGGTDWQAATRAVGDEYFHGGPALVNDEAGGWNPELIVANGRAFIANGGDPAVIRLPRGARIFTADETRDIFNGGGDLINLPAFADGFYEGSIKRKKPKGTGTKSSASSGSSGSSGGGSTAFTDDMMKKLEQYMSEILDVAEDALNDQLEAINAQIYALKYQTEAAEKATALEEARLELLEAEKNLLDANTERTVRYYNAATGQWEWMADQREVMRAQEELYDAQKNLLEAEYDALATAWNELKDEIAKALENNEEIDINAILKALGKSAAKGSLPGLKSLIGDIGTYTDDPRAWANFDGGGLAHGVGWMPKGSRGTEAVLDANLTKAILNPHQNAAFTNFTDSLSTLFSMAGGSGGLPSSRFSSNVSNLYGGNTYIEGVRIGSDMMNRPLSEVLSTLNLYKNN